MKMSTNVTYVFLAMTLFSSSIFAQVMIKKGSGEDSSVQIIKEVGALLSEKDQVVSVMMVLPEDARPKGYKEIVVKKDDQILMLNKKRIKSLADFEKIYNELEIDELVKMGVRRDGELMIVEFKKIDPEKLPKGRQMMIRTAEAGSESAVKTRSF